MANYYDDKFKPPKFGATDEFAPPIEKSDFYSTSDTDPEHKELWESFYREQRDVEQPALCNEALAALANPSRGIAGYVRGKASEANRRMTQMDLVKAQKIIVEDSLIRHCVEAGMDNPKNLAKMCQNAKPCFDLLWVEWDDWVKIDQMTKTYPKVLKKPLLDEPNKGIRTGYLIKKLNGKYLCMPVGKLPENKIAFIGHGFYFSPDEAITLEWSNQMADNNLRDNDEQAFFKHQFESWIRLMGPPWVDHYMPDYFDADGNYSITIPDDYPAQTELKAGFELDFLASRVLPCQANFGMITKDEVWNRGWRKDEMARTLKMNLSAMTGDLRFLITVFSFLNYPHLVYTDETPSKTSHIRHGRRVPENEYRKITIDLPKRCVVSRRSILTGTGTPKRQHMRRGHPRVYRDRKTGREVRRIWIEPQLVGNPENGTIEHDYHLRGKKGG